MSPPVRLLKTVRLLETLEYKIKAGQTIRMANKHKYRGQRNDKLSYYKSRQQDKARLNTRPQSKTRLKPQGHKASQE